MTAVSKKKEASTKKAQVLMVPLEVEVKPELSNRVVRAYWSGWTPHNSPFGFSVAQWTNTTLSPQKRWKFISEEGKEDFWN